MSLEWVNRYYSIEAKRGSRVEYTGEAGKVRYGTIAGASGGHLNIKLDGEKHANPFHPTWELRILDAAEAAKAVQS